MLLLVPACQSFPWHFFFFCAFDWTHLYFSLLWALAASPSCSHWQGAPSPAEHPKVQYSLHIRTIPPVTVAPESPIELLISSPWCYDALSVALPARRPPGDNTVELLESLGADVVVTPDILGNSEDYARAVAGLPRPRLGLNCVGGSIATSVSRANRPSSPLALNHALRWDCVR